MGALEGAEVLVLAPEHVGRGWRAAPGRLLRASADRRRQRLVRVQPGLARTRPPRSSSAMAFTPTIIARPGGSRHPGRARTTTCSSSRPWLDGPTGARGGDGASRRDMTLATTVALAGGAAARCQLAEDAGGARSSSPAAGWSSASVPGSSARATTRRSGSTSRRTLAPVRRGDRRAPRAVEPDECAVRRRASTRPQV